MARQSLLEFRRDTAANWTSANPVLAAGEPGWESDTNKLKIGDGSTAWNSLGYFSAAGSGVTSVDGISGAVVLHAGTNVTITDNSPSAGDITIAASGGGGGVTEYDYVEKTSNTTITATTDGNSNGTAIIDGNAVTYDGSTRILIEFWAIALEINEPNVGHINLYDGTTDLGRLILFGIGAGTGTTDSTGYGARFLTPSAGSHTYHIRGWKSGGTFTVGGGAGGASTLMPTWYRITKA